MREYYIVEIVDVKGDPKVKWKEGDIISGPYETHKAAWYVYKTMNKPKATIVRRK